MRMNVYRGVYYGQVLAKKNSKSIGFRNGKPFIRNNNRVSVQESEMAKKFQDDFIEEGFIESFESGVEVIVEIWNQDRRCRDLDNQISTVLDALVLGGIIKDDSQDYVRRIKGYVRGIDKENPHVIATIYEITD